MRRSLLALFAVSLCAVAAGPAAASVDPWLAVTPRAVHRGGELTVRGISWVVGAGCEPRVTIRLRRGSTSLRIARPRVPATTAAFRVAWTVPENLDRGTWRVVATQRCDDGAPYTRTRSVTIH